MKQDFFSHNRRQLGDRLGGGLVVLTAYDSLQKQNDTAHEFAQEANFWYLTGIEQPGWRVVIDGTRRRSWLVAPAKDSVHTLFDGDLTVDEARRISGVDEVIVGNDEERLLRDLARKHSVIYTLSEDPHASFYDFVQNPAPKELRAQLERIFPDVRDCRKELAKLRAIKQPEEIAALERAVNLTVKTFDEVRQQWHEFKSEYAIDAHFTYRFRQANAHHAYQPIVAGGPRACTMHYEANSEKLSARDMVVMDIGARVDGYAADVTRTYCQRPTKRQKAVHAAVERAHQRIVALIEPGLPLADYSKQSDEIMKDALQEVGLLDDRSDEVVYRQYFPHAISHGLGVDVHESLGGPRCFEPGMVLTVEPGIYIPDEGIGVRIEDDILVTPTGHKNLSGKLPTGLN